jgi:hypothetical protein
VPEEVEDSESEPRVGVNVTVSGIALRMFTENEYVPAAETLVVLDG